MKHLRLFSWGLLLLLTMAGTAYVAYRFWDRLIALPGMVESISFTEWLLIAAVVGIYYLADYGRLYSLLYLLGSPVTLLQGLRVVCMSESAALATPTGGIQGPMAVYLLVRRKVPFADATAAVAASLVYMIVWVSAFGLAAMLLNGRALPETISHNIFWYSLPVSLILSLFVGVVVFGPKIHGWIAPRLNHLGEHHWVLRALRWVDHLATAVATIGSSRRKSHFLSHLSCFGMILAYCLTGYVLCRALDFPITFPRALVTFAVSLMAVYITPVSGAVGVTEIFTAYLLDPDLGGRALAIAVLLRILCRYMLVLPGLVLLLDILRREGAKYFVRGIEKAAEES